MQCLDWSRLHMMLPRHTHARGNNAFLGVCLRPFCSPFLSRVYTSCAIHVLHSRTAHYAEACCFRRQTPLLSPSLITLRPIFHLRCVLAPGPNQNRQFAGGRVGNVFLSVPSSCPCFPQVVLRTHSLFCTRDVITTPEMHSQARRTFWWSWQKPGPLQGRRSNESKPQRQKESAVAYSILSAVCVLWSAKISIVICPLAPCMCNPTHPSLPYHPAHT